MRHCVPRFWRDATFSASDTAGAPLVGVINETMARRFFGSENPIGQYVYIELQPGQSAPLIQIIGVVVDAKYRTLRETTPATMYFPVAQLADPHAQIMTEQPSFEIRTVDASRNDRAFRRAGAHVV